MYGKDFKLKNGDIIFSPSGDIETIEGPALVVQDIARELTIPCGEVIWDPVAGSYLFSFLGDNVSEGAILTELERVARNDYRVDAASVEAKKNGIYYQLKFIVLGDDQMREIEVPGGENG